ncbi:MAG: DUF3426 domain-containing protein [Thiohalospira sp.]
MYTQCPNCHSHFRVTAEQLRAADGRVRCGVCDTVFDALEHLEEALPRTEPDPEAVAPPEPEDRPQAPVEDESPPRRPRQSAGTRRKGDRPAARASRGRRVAATTGWLVASLLLLALFPAQFLYFERNALAANYPELRPTLEQLCEVAGCRVEPQRDPDAFSISGREIRAHPERKEALRVTAELVNNADYAQPLPFLHLILSDQNKEPLAAGRFEPGDYHSAPPERLSPGEAASVELDIPDPGPEAVNFRFQLR